MDIDKVKITELDSGSGKKYLAQSPLDNFRMEYAINDANQLILHSYCGSGLTMEEIRSIARRGSQNPQYIFRAKSVFSVSFFDKCKIRSKTPATAPQIPPELKKELEIYYTLEYFELQGQQLLSLRNLNGAYAQNFRLPFSGQPYLLYTTTGQLYGVCQFSTSGIIPSIERWNQAHTRSKMYLPEFEKLLLVKEFPLDDDGLPDAESLVKFFDQADTDFGKACKNKLSVY